MILTNSDPSEAVDAEGGDRLSFWQYSWLAPRCAALNRFGQPCGNLARKDSGFCRYHSGDQRPRWARKPRGPDNPQRAHRREMEHVWRRDPWVPGFTCIVDDEARQVFLDWLDGHRVHLDWLAPALANWLTWQFVGLVRRGQLYEMEGDVVIEELRRRDAATADPPAGGCVEDMTANSEAFAWRPRLKLKGKWVQPQTDARTHPPGVRLPIRRKETRNAPTWKPLIGAARLTADERMALAHAEERDRMLGGGTREVRKARERIVQLRKERGFS